jgi:hypothetical protein
MITSRFWKPVGDLMAQYPKFRARRQEARSAATVRFGDTNMVTTSTRLPA